MTRYAVCIAAIEAVGVATAALLPVGREGSSSGGSAVVVIVVYAASLLPTLVVARGARVRRIGAPGRSGDSVGRPRSRRSEPVSS